MLGASFNWLTAQVAFAFLRLLKLLPADTSLNVADRFARWLGPKTSRHKLVLYNLRRAFPEKSVDEINAIALESWASMGRLAAEYVFLDALYDLDPDHPGGGRIEVTGFEHFQNVQADPRPFIFFASHSGCFELIPMVGSSFAVTPAVLFRPPNNPYIAAKVDTLRRARMGRLVPSLAGSSLTLARTLSAGGGIGVLVDQKFPRGLQTTFFGLPVRTNPLVPKFARQFGCDVFPVHCVRLAGNRYRIVIEPPIEAAKAEDGSLDVAATAQIMNDHVERWVRENPGQWLWYHDRWNIKHQLGL